jgi:hypothetical protein
MINSRKNGITSDVTRKYISYKRNYTKNQHKFLYFLNYLFIKYGDNCLDLEKIYEPRHDKTNIMGLRPAWIQTSLRIHAVWSGSMLFAISFVSLLVTELVSEQHGSWSDCADFSFWTISYTFLHISHILCADKGINNYYKVIKCMNINIPVWGCVILYLLCI